MDDPGRDPADRSAACGGQPYSGLPGNRPGADRDADAEGKLPEDLPRGVLSEDLIYDVIIGNRDNALRMLELGTEILKKL